MTMPWPRDAFVSAVFETDQLKPLERLVALVYADHARAQDFAWVTIDRMRSRTGLSRDAVLRARSGLVEKGWLTLKESAAQHNAARYWLTPSVHQRSGTRTPDTAQESGKQTAEECNSASPGPLESLSSTSPVTRGTSPVTSRPSGVPDYSSVLHNSLLDAREDEGLPEHHYTVVEALVLRHAPDLDRATAARAVATIETKKSPENIAAYVARFDLDSIRRWAGKPGRAVLPACEHGRTAGREIRGRGEDASRICGQCEADDPAADSRQEVAS